MPGPFESFGKSLQWPGPGPGSLGHFLTRQAVMVVRTYPLESASSSKLQRPKTVVAPGGHSSHGHEVIGLGDAIVYSQLLCNQPDRSVIGGCFSPKQRG